MFYKLCDDSARIGVALFLQYTFYCSKTLVILLGDFNSNLSQDTELLMSYVGKNVWSHCWLQVSVWFMSTISMSSNLLLFTELIFFLKPEDGNFF